MKQLHHHQLAILNKLVFAPSLRYSQLKPSPDLENNLFDFHLDKLIALGYVSKNSTNYILTPTGKEYSTRLDTQTVQIIKQAKLSAWMGVVRDTPTGQEYVVYTRLKHPFYGCQGFLGGRIQFGETVIQTARRELLEETGLVGEPHIVRLIHYRVFDPGHQLLEDKFMFLCRVLNPSGKLVSRNEEGKYEWVAKHNLHAYITNYFESEAVFLKQLAAITNPNTPLTVEETDVISHTF